MKHALAKFSFLDRRRVGVFGWSYGETVCWSEIVAPLVTSSVFLREPCRTAALRCIRVYVWEKGRERETVR